MTKSDEPEIPKSKPARPAPAAAQPAVAPEPTRNTHRTGKMIALGIATAAILVVSTAALTAAAINGPAQHGMDMGAMSAAPTESLAPVNTTGFPQGGANRGIFTDTCDLALTAPNDPIMLPGKTGSAMQHDFFGNTSVTANSTPKELVGGKTTCTTSADASAYWTPVVYQDGKILKPTKTLIYWRAPAETASSTKTMPAGMTMIAGDETATTDSQSAKVINWTCQATAQKLVTRPSTTPQDCAGSVMRLVITFPNCWDGKSLDGMGQKNVVYATGKGETCPSDHPVQIPQIVMHINYPTSTGAGITLSTGPTEVGPPVSGHADFMMGWNQSVMNADVAACVTAQVRCGATSGPTATPKGGVERDDVAAKVKTMKTKS